MAKPDSAIDKDSFIVRAAMPYYVTHALEHRDIYQTSRATRESNAVYSAHNSYLNLKSGSGARSHAA
jgi:hypothetical protein